jgi:energy-coupling factor transporter ATP-binding protein EcfA2
LTSIESEILDWIGGRPIWQRNILKRIVRGELIDDDYIAATAQSLVDDNEGLELPELTAADIPTTGTGGSTVCLTSIGNLENVNALHTGQVLEFGEVGLTVVYGDNGSGKSGYARVVKAAVGARHRESILPDAFSESSGEPTATIAYVVDGNPLEGQWPDLDDTALPHIHFYDEACGNDYLDRETELAYRPSILTLLDALILHTDSVRDAVESMIALSDEAALTTPAVLAGTAGAALVSNLSAATKQEAIDELLTLDDGAEELLADRIKEVTRLRTTDQAKEKARLKSAADGLEALAEHFEDIEALLAPSAAEKLVEHQATALELRAAANAASQTSFSDEPLAGVGSATWRAMWRAAEQYAQAEPYPEQEFPVTTDGAFCVLCQQPLEADGRERLRRFHQFVHDDIATRASGAEATFKEAFDAVEDIAVSSELVSGSIAFLTAEDKPLSEFLATAIATAKLARQRVLDRLNDESEEPWIELAGVDTDALRTMAVGVRRRSESIDEDKFKRGLEAASASKDELEACITLAKMKTDIQSEVERLKTRALLTKIRGSISTQAVTRLSSDLTRKHVTDVVREHFVNESERMKLEHVVLADRGGSKGRLHHQPSLLGASGSSPKAVLSEGEQTAAGLAGFFTEATFDETRSALVFDDPMSSLDHERRALEARRIVEFAEDRQVIVFTHDLVFLGDLVRYAAELNVPTTDRTIERDTARKPGLVVDNHPWKAKDADKRIGDLKADLDRIEKDKESMSPAEYSDATAKWGGQLSQTWERIVRSEVVNNVVDRGTSEVRPKMFRLLAEITSEDNDDFQRGYGAASRWAIRHDPSEEVSYLPPEPEELKEEYERIKAWRARLKKYKAGS